jgi:predicted nuclease of restriction endonuclease-like (RecB) superfamily
MIYYDLVQEAVAQLFWSHTLVLLEFGSGFAFIGNGKYIRLKRQD